LKVILIRPRFDSATHHTFAFAGEILEWCKAAGIEVVELTESEVVRENVEGQLRKGADVFIFYDHGDEDALIGQDEKPVIDLKNCHFLKEKETYTLACLSAKKLGVEVWRRGGKYWGYTEVVGFTTDALKEFQKAFNCGFMYMFIDGASHEAALDKARETFDQLSMQLVSQGKIMAAIIMRRNKEILVSYNAHGPEEESPAGCLLAILKFPWTLLRLARKK